MECGHDHDVAAGWIMMHGAPPPSDAGIISADAGLRLACQRQGLRLLDGRRVEQFIVDQAM